MSFKEKKPCGKIVVGDVLLRRVKDKSGDLYHADSPTVGQVVVYEIKEEITGKGGHKGVKARFRFLGSNEDKVGDLYNRDLIGHLSNQQIQAEERKRKAAEAKAKRDANAQAKAEAGKIPLALYQYLKNEQPFGCNTEAAIKAFRLLLEKGTSKSKSKSKSKGKKK